MRRIFLLAGVLAACGGAGAPAPGAVTARPAPAGRCETALRGFAPGADAAVETFALGEVSTAGTPADEEASFGCRFEEPDEACVQRVREALIADVPGAVVQDATLSGEPDGYQGIIEIDGRLYPLLVARDADFAAEAMRLQAAGHVVIPREIRRIYKRETRRAVVRWTPPLDAAAPRAWQAQVVLRSDRGDDEGAIAAMLELARAETERRGLVIHRWERTDARRLRLVLRCGGG